MEEPAAPALLLPSADTPKEGVEQGCLAIRLSRCAVKAARTVLRGGGGNDAASLPDRALFACYQKLFTVVGRGREAHYQQRSSDLLREMLTIRTFWR